MTSTNKLEPIRIQEAQDAERAVILHPEDDDLFIQTGKQVIEACRLNISLEVWLHEFRSAVETVINWSRERANQVRSCFVEPRGKKIALFFVPVADHFDFDLADALTDLNTELVQKFNIGLVEIYQVPDRELERFLDQSVRCIHDERAIRHMPENVN